jgi:NADH-quinone oxidoreductase subunit N
LLSRQGFESEQIDDLKGLAKRSPWFAGMMAILMFSLAGLPPTVGFYAKLAVLQAVVSTNVAGYIWLAGAAVCCRWMRRVTTTCASSRSCTSTSRPTRARSRAAWRRARCCRCNGIAVLVFGVLPGGTHDAVP